MGVSNRKRHGPAPKQSEPEGPLPEPSCRSPLLATRAIFSASPAGFRGPLDQLLPFPRTESQRNERCARGPVERDRQT